MSRGKSLTDAGVATLKSRAARYSFPDPELGGHYIRVTPGGAKSYCAASRDPQSGKQVWATIGSTDLMNIDDARGRARNAIRRIRAGLVPFRTTMGPGRPMRYLPSRAASPTGLRHVMTTTCHPSPAA